MRGAVLPAALLCLAFVFMLAFAPGRARVPALVTAVGALIAGLLIGWPPQWHEAAFLTAWASIIAMSASVHLPQSARVWKSLALVFGAVTGFSIAAVIAYEGRVSDLARVLPVLFAYAPARFIANRGWAIAVKVAASWLIAVAILAALLPLAPTPGYVRDHME